jgi:hypothetical protein
VVKNIDPSEPSIQNKALIANDISAEKDQIIEATWTTATLSERQLKKYSLSHLDKPVLIPAVYKWVS